jgi:O-antigen/teichoic acid export membrane protein
LANLVLCFVLIPLLGALGAAVSSAAAEVVVLAVSFLYFRRHFRPIFFPSLMHALIAGTAMAVAYFATPLEGSYAFAGKLLVGTVAFLMVLWAFGELSSSRIETLRRLFRLSRDS